MSDQTAEGAWAERAQLLRVMGHPVRLMLLAASAHRSQCVKGFNPVAQIAQAQLSRHMAALRKAELVDRHAQVAGCRYYLLRPTLTRRIIRLIAREPPRCGAAAPFCVSSGGPRRQGRLADENGVSPSDERLPPSGVVASPDGMNVAATSNGDRAALREP